ncbi:TonB family protein [Fulvivirgaceae bacterium PWU4]|uniref:TonB family protein n=1 Tax=Chryseosolibacter histidini TaxID=2782349 RepID=A0AAP2GMJ4_9BACT|nr:energy transducer TonB [Chryseosolibacter histidini]MBT1697058.1 TonB family protein [Chryseosolibacter histidini]
MKTLKTIIFAILIPATAYCQQSQKVWQYLDEHCMATEDSMKAAYFRTVENTVKTIIVRDYYISGELEMVAECSSIIPRVVMDGKVTNYHKNGKISEEGFYKINSRTGPFKAYYENGSLKSEVSYDNTKQTYLGYWRENGESLLDHGNGHIFELIKDSFYHKEIVDSVMVNYYAVKEGTTDTVYLFLDKEPEYRGGYEFLMRDIQANMYYPRDARRNGIEGTVYVTFVIDKEGKVADAEVLKGIDPECDQIARRAVTKLKPWIPGMVRNKPVFVRFNLPVKFRLK